MPWIVLRSWCNPKLFFMVKLCSPVCIHKRKTGLEELSAQLAYKLYRLFFFLQLQNLFNIHMVINKFHIAWVWPRYNGIPASHPAAFSGVFFSVEFVWYLSSSSASSPHTQLHASSGCTRWYWRGVDTPLLNAVPQRESLNNILVSILYSWSAQMVKCWQKYLQSDLRRLCLLLVTATKLA